MADLSKKKKKRNQEDNGTFLNAERKDSNLAF